jgi:hypothetical protein
VANKLEAGQCITAEAYSHDRMDAEAFDCNRSDATLQLVSQGYSTATCSDGNRKGGQYPVLTNDARTRLHTYRDTSGEPARTRKQAR